MLSRDEPEPSRKLASRSEDGRVCHSCGDGACNDRTDAWNGFQPLAHLACPVPGVDLLLDLTDALMGVAYLPDHHQQSVSRNGGNTLILSVFDEENQLL